MSKEEYAANTTELAKHVHLAEYADRVGDKELAEKLKRDELAYFNE